MRHVDLFSITDWLPKPFELRDINAVSGISAFIPDFVGPYATASVEL